VGVGKKVYFLLCVLFYKKIVPKILGGGGGVGSEG